MDEQVTSEKNNKTMLGVGLGVVALVLIGGGFLLLNNSQNTKPAQQTINTQVTAIPSHTESSPAVEGASQSATTVVKAFNIEGGNFYFKPNEIRVKKGDKVKITFTNKDGIHDFVLDEFNVQTKKIRTDESDSVEFTADKSGTFEFYCSVGEHRQMGMKGNLIIE